MSTTHRETETIRLKEAQGRLHRLQQEVAARASAVPEFDNSGTTDSGRMLDFGQFDFGQFDFGQLAEIELAEVLN